MPRTNNTGVATAFATRANYSVQSHNGNMSYDHRACTVYSYRWYPLATMHTRPSGPLALIQSEGYSQSTKSQRSQVLRACIRHHVPTLYVPNLYAAGPAAHSLNTLYLHSLILREYNRATHARVHTSLEGCARYLADLTLYCDYFEQSRPAIPTHIDNALRAIPTHEVSYA